MACNVSQKEESAILDPNNKYPTPTFLIGVGTTDPQGCVSSSVLKTFRENGINYFLPFTSWASIEISQGSYTGAPCPGESFISSAADSRATLNGHCLIFMFNKSYVLPSFAFNRPFEELKVMLKNFVRATVARFTKIKIWTLNEPIAQNALGYSREQNYDLFVSASKLIHEVNPNAKVMINMIPIPVNWSGLDYNPNTVLDDLFERGLEADIIGIEFYPFFAEEKDKDSNGYPKLDWINGRIDIFRKYNLPIILSEIAVSGMVNGQNRFNEQADWMESIFRFAKADTEIIGATWYFVRDEPSFLPYCGLVNNDYSFRPVAQRLLELAMEWSK
jgi:GH35 family endo-1,4-beta-xylanase